MRIGLIALILTIVCYGQVAALESDAKQAFICKSNVAANQLASELERVQKAYTSVGSLSASFVQDSYLAALDTEEVSSGSVIYKKPGQMQWSYKSPEPQVFTFRDHTVWLYQPEVRQVIIDDVSEVLLSDLPVSFLLGIGDLAKDFIIKGGCQSDSGTVLELAPKATVQKQDQELKSFKLLLSNNKSFPIGAKISDLAGNSTAVLFKNMKENLSLDSKLFLAKYPQGTDINDKRRN